MVVTMKYGIVLLVLQCGIVVSGCHIHCRCIPFSLWYKVAPSSHAYSIKCRFTEGGFTEKSLLQSVDRSYVDKFFRFSPHHARRLLQAASYVFSVNVQKIKHLQISKFYDYIWNQRGTWIKMSTNKPMFGPVVLEIIYGISISTSSSHHSKPVVS